MSEYVPVAVNCSVSPLGTLGLVGETAIDRKTAALTVRTDEPVTPLSVALIVEGPIATPVAKPCDPAVFEIVATEGVAEAHVTWLVRFCVELSEYVPLAVNCSVSPLGTLGFTGETAIDCKTAALTVSTVELVTPLSVALIVEVPIITPVAKPCDPDAFEIVATEGVAEAHVTWLVRFCVESSEYVPVAVNCSDSPLGTLGSAGETAIDCKTGALSVYPPSMLSIVWARVNESR